MTTATLTALQELQGHQQWVCWKMEARNEGEKPTKIPYNPRNGRKAMAGVASTWASYQLARKCYQAGGYTGVGYELLKETGITAVDLDACIDENGQLASWAREIVDLLNSYTEYSPSGSGLHIFVRGTIPTCFNRKIGEKIEGEKQSGIEMYDTTHFFTITGEHLDGTPDTIEDRQAELLQLHTQYTKKLAPKKPEPKKAAPTTTSLNLSDSELIEKARRAANGGNFDALWNGNTGGYGSASEADLALCMMLAFWTGKDAIRVEHLFSQSALGGREKWQRPDYRERTIDAALDACGEVYDPAYREASTASASDNPEKTVDFVTICQSIRDAIEKEDAETICNMAEEISLLKDEQVLAIKAMVGKHSKKLALTARDFDKLIAAARVAKVLAQQAEIEEMPFYKATPDGMGFRTRDGDYNLISNFSGKIITDLLLDDGAERIRHFELATICQDKQKSFTVAAADYDKAEWVNNELGSCAQITVAKMMKWHLTEAIKSVSDASIETRYSHTGWRNINGQMVYLHAGGGLSPMSPPEREGTHQPDSPLDGLLEPTHNSSESSESSESHAEEKIITYLKNSLTHYSLPSGDFSTSKDRVRASLAALDITSDTITVPLYTSLWRAVLSLIDYGVHLAGQTGKGKSELCALIQQHFGATMTARRLPGSWLSTENALEMLMFQCKDAVLVIDDFKPIGSKNDQDRLHSKADGVFRRVGNNTSRGRLTAKLEGRPERPPRCMILSTGEDTPRGESLKGRGFFLLMEESITTVGSEAQQRLTACQQAANSGIYAECMSAYIQWLSPRIAQIQAGLHEEIAKERERLRVVGHARSGSNTASALVGMRYFLEFAVEVEALSQDEATALFKRCEQALLLIAEEAAVDRQEDRPTEQWKTLVMSAIAGKKAYLLNRDGTTPGDKYGWVQDDHGVDLIGWIDGDNLYLDPHLTYKVVTALGQATRNEVTTSEINLRKYLAQDNVLASTDQHKARKRLTVRTRIQDSQMDVLHLKMSTIFPDDDKLNSDSNDLSVSKGTQGTQGDSDWYEGSSQAILGSESTRDSEKSAPDSGDSTQQYEGQNNMQEDKKPEFERLYNELRTVIKDEQKSKIIAPVGVVLLQPIEEEEYEEFII